MTGGRQTAAVEALDRRRGGRRWRPLCGGAERQRNGCWSSAAARSCATRGSWTPSCGWACSTWSRARASRWTTSCGATCPSRCRCWSSWRSTMRTPTTSSPSRRGTSGGARRLWQPSRATSLPAHGLPSALWPSTGAPSRWRGRWRARTRRSSTPATRSALARSRRRSSCAPAWPSSPCACTASSWTWRAPATSSARCWRRLGRRRMRSRPCPPTASC
mmetsp:Transcript_2530/g.9000  ORF Transcript_2530/g.9000 Transcript_2530/m.9000 type:complete len:218 (-) Transcript_2530:65-718(-)